MRAVASTLIAATLSGATVVLCQQSNIPKKLLPVDEAVQDSDLLQTRNALMEAAKRRDLRTIRKFTDPNLQVSMFGQLRGLQSLEREWKRTESTKEFFSELATVLALGGRFEDAERRTFVAPYFYLGFPDTTDMPGAWVALTAKTPVFSKPDRSSSVLTYLSYDVIRGAVTRFPNWATVYLPDGRTGFVHESDARNAADTHAHFAKTSRGWRLVAFYGGVD
jgi:hypothetical protein